MILPKTGFEGFRPRRMVALRGFAVELGSGSSFPRYAVRVSYLPRIATAGEWRSSDPRRPGGYGPTLRVVDVIPRVKICCIASVEEARLAVNLGASALGLVSAMPSGPGPIAEDLIASIAAVVPPPVATFLLTTLERLSKPGFAELVRKVRAVVSERSFAHGLHTDG